MDDTKIRCLGFTGSAPVGHQLQRVQWTSSSGKQCDARPGVSRHLHAKSRKATPTAVFDFVRKAGEEQKKALDALRKGKGMDYVRDKVKRDLEQVSKFSEGLTKSREKLARDLGSIVTGKEKIEEVEEVLEELEEVLIMSDLGIDTVDKVLDDLRQDAREQRLQTKNDIKALLKSSLVRILQQVGTDVSLNGDGGVEQQNQQTNGSATNKTDSTTQKTTGPIIYLVMGANGMGKTTTIGKLATRLRREGNSVLVAACDTFRAAAVEQLEEWVRRADGEIVKAENKKEAASGVLYKALQRGYDEAFDYVLIDTSGRLHTNVNLMGELQKMVRVVQKFRVQGPHETLLVVDASIGRNAVVQAKTWRDQVGVSALAVTKLDGTARAGFVVSCVDELQLPVKLVGVGEGVDDLRDFDAQSFVDGLVG